MFKVTNEHLKRRSSRELSALFNHVQRGIVWLANPSAERSTALAVLAMIRAELTRRGLDP